jgi:hypothetical protein
MRNIPESLTWCMGEKRPAGPRGSHPTFHLNTSSTSNAWGPTYGAYKHPPYPPVAAHTSCGFDTPAKSSNVCYVYPHSVLLI